MASQQRGEPADLTRRDFVRLGLGAGAAALGGSALAGWAQEDVVWRNRIDEKMAYAKLGRTNLMVSRLALGGVPFQAGVALPALEMGVNLVHGAQAYKTMDAQAKALKGHWDRVWYALKANPAGDEVDKCLQILGIEQVAFVMLVFSKDQGIANPTIKESFDKLKQQGKAQFLGCTVHSEPGNIPGIVQAAVDAGFYDLILTMYQPAVVQALDPILAEARNKGIGTMSMKTIQGAGNATQAIGSAIARGNIDTVLKAIGNTEQLGQYAAAVKTNAQARLDTRPPDPLGDRVACGACGACVVCPQRIAIRDIMRCETYYARTHDSDDHAREVYRSLPEDRTAAACLDCGTCERACPRNLPVRELIHSAHAKWA